MQLNEEYTVNYDIKKLKSIIVAFENFQKTSVPLCAAENVMSDFCKIPLSASFQERYIMGSAYDYTMNDNFIGSEVLLPFYTQIQELSFELFHAKYSDARTLTGMNCLCMLVMALTKQNDNVMILGKEWGGHASVKPILERLGINVFEAPYLLDKYDFDYNELNSIVTRKKINYLLFAPSDILYPLDLRQIDDSQTTVLFDGSQILGLIAAGLIDNPLDSLKNCVLFGGTHKTMPGPAHGLILTNNDDLYAQIDKNINPKYLRNTQMHQVICLLFTLIEMKYFGKEYQTNTVITGNSLGKALEEHGFTVAAMKNVYTNTHQIFIECSERQMLTIFNNAIKEHVTLNTKKKSLFHGGFGIRLGQQEISRYKWNDDAIKAIAQILFLLKNENFNHSEAQKIIQNLPPKNIQFTFTADEYLNTPPPI
jgi:glycine/serine hydroxymethyltransferase